MSWHQKRQVNKSQASRENGSKLTIQEKLKFSGADFNRNLKKKNGRMVRIRVKSYDHGIYFYFKLFKLKTVSEDDRQSEQRIRLLQLALTIDEFSAFTALAGSVEADDLSEKNQRWRSEFDRLVANLMQGRIPSDGLPISVENAS